MKKRKKKEKLFLSLSRVFGLFLFVRAKKIFLLLLCDISHVRVFRRKSVRGILQFLLFFYALKVRTPLHINFFFVVFFVVSFVLTTIMKVLFSFFCFFIARGNAFKISL